MTQYRRLFQGPEDLKTMQLLIQRNWDLTARQHIGDIAWGWHSTGSRDEDWPTVLWFDGETCVGWGWIELPGELWFKVDREYGHLSSEILSWFEETAIGDTLRVEVLDQEDILTRPLSKLGYSQDTSEPFALHMVRNLDDIQEVTLPPGFTARNMSEGISITTRVQAHTSAWSSLPFHHQGRVEERAVTSRITSATHTAVMQAWPYRSDLDWIIFTPDGTPVACCIVWYDAINKVAELEPVGTHPKFRKLGLGAAVCVSALRAAKNLGATRAIVYPRGDEAYPVPKKLYESIGFKPYGRTRIYQKRR